MKLNPYKIEKEKESVNQDLHEILWGYYSFSSKKELRNDWGMPLIISSVVFIIVGIFSNSNMLVLDIIVDINSVTLSVMAILAGFNTTSLAVIASTNQETLKHLLSVRISDIDDKENKEKNILRQVLTFFSYAIAVQLFVLIIGATIVLLNKNLQPLYLFLGIIGGTSARVILSLFGLLWFTIILHSLFVSLRNVSLLYRYIFFIAQRNNK